MDNTALVAIKAGGASSRDAMDRLFSEHFPDSYDGWGQGSGTPDYFFINGVYSQNGGDPAQLQLLEEVNRVLREAGLAMDAKLYAD